MLATTVAISSVQLSVMPCFVSVVTPLRNTQLTATIKRGQVRLL